MPGILEQYDEASRDEQRHAQLAAEARWKRGVCLLALHRDGMTHRAIAHLVGLEQWTVRRLIARVRTELEGA